MTSHSLTSSVRQDDKLVARLLNRGDQLAIVNGKIWIKPISSRAIPVDWLNEHREPLLIEILKLTGQNSFLYDSFKTGNYGSKNAAGVTLQFINLMTSQSVYTVFNARLTRIRNTKAGAVGTPLPAGQFHITKKSHFYRFWQTSGLSMPPRLSSFHDYMGLLKGIFFEAELGPGNRLIKTTLTPMNIPYEQIKAALEADPTPDNSRTSSRQVPDNSRTGMPDKESPQTHTEIGYPPHQSTGNFKYGNKLSRKSGYTGQVVNPEGHRTTEEVNPDDWLDNYDRGAEHSTMPRGSINSRARTNNRIETNDRTKKPNDFGQTF